MKSSKRLVSVIVVLFISLTTFGCGGQDDTAGGIPAPYDKAAEFALGDAYQEKAGTRVTVHQIAHRQTLGLESWHAQKAAERGEKIIGLAAEVEVCAADDNSSPEQLPHGAFRLYAISEFRMGERSEMLIHGVAPADLGMKEPLLRKVALDGGGCKTGWVDFVNIYGEHGDPTKLGYLEDPLNEHAVQAVWLAGEED